MRYLFIGSVQYSATCLRALLEMDIDLVDIMCPDRESSSFNSDYSDLGETAVDYGRSVYYFKNIKDEVRHINEIKPDIVFVLGFSQLIPGEILKIPKIGCLGSHPALLPENRGRHPIIWAIANGLEKSGITLFWIDGGVDSGDIWAQKEFDINMSDDASSVYEKIEKLSIDMLKENVPNLEQVAVNRVKQEASRANYWRKRTPKDGEIDWRMSGKRIYDLVRALTKPYPGAHCMYKGEEIRIWKVKPADETGEYKNIEPGKIISVDGSSIKIKTGDGVIEIMEHNFKPLPLIGEYL